MEGDSNDRVDNTDRKWSTPTSVATIRTGPLHPFKTLYLSWLIINGQTIVGIELNSAFEVEFERLPEMLLK